MAQPLDVLIDHLYEYSGGGDFIVDQDGRHVPFATESYWRTLFGQQHRYVPTDLEGRLQRFKKTHCERGEEATALDVWKALSKMVSLTDETLESNPYPFLCSPYMRNENGECFFTVAISEELVGNMQAAFTSCNCPAFDVQHFTEEANGLIRDANTIIKNFNDVNYGNANIDIAARWALRYLLFSALWGPGRYLRVLDHQENGVVRGYTPREVGVQALAEGDEQAIARWSLREVVFEQNSRTRFMARDNVISFGSGRIACVGRELPAATMFVSIPTYNPTTQQPMAVSGNHLVVLHDQVSNTWEVQDLASSNGTLVIHYRERKNADGTEALVADPKMLKSDAGPVAETIRPGDVICLAPYYNEERDMYFPNAASGVSYQLQVEYE